MKPVVPSARVWRKQEDPEHAWTTLAAGADGKVEILAANGVFSIRTPLEATVLEAGHATVTAVDLANVLRGFAPETQLTVETSEGKNGTRLALSEDPENVQDMPDYRARILLPSIGNPGPWTSVKRNLLLQAKTVINAGAKRPLEEVYRFWSLWITPRLVRMAGGDGRCFAVVEAAHAQPERRSSNTAVRQYSTSRRPRLSRQLHWPSLTLTLTGKRPPAPPNGHETLPAWLQSMQA